MLKTLLLSCLCIMAAAGCQTSGDQLDTLAMFFKSLQFTDCLQSDNRKGKSVDLFVKENLIAWCVVPYDTMHRGPEERARMLMELGFTKFAWDWREQHLPVLPDEINALRNHKIELTAVWLWIDKRASDSNHQVSEYG